MVCILFALLVYLLLGFGLGAGLPLWNAELKLVYLAFFPLHALLFFLWPHFIRFGKKLADHLWEEDTFF